MARSTGPARQPTWSGAVVVLVTLVGLVYLRAVFAAAFVYDDVHAIVDNDAIRSLWNWPLWFTDPGRFSSLPFGGMYRPLVLLSHGVTYALAGLDPRAFRAGNLLVHTVNGVLVLGLLHRVGSGRVAALGGALLFALHPVNTEAVAYASSRSESLAAFFALACLLTHPLRDRRWWAVGFYGGALLCKSVAVVVPGLLLLHDRILRRQPVDGDLVRRHAPYWAVTALYLLGMRPALTSSLAGEPVRALSTQMWTQVKACLYYAWLAVVPRGLSVEHAFSEATGPGQVPVAGALAVLISGIGVAAVVWRRGGAGEGPQSRRLVAFWLLWLPVVLAPTFVIPLNVLVNEHRLYLATVALGGLLAALWPAVSAAHGRLLRTGAGLGLGVLAVLAYQRSSVWVSSEALWSDALHKAPAMPRVHLFAGDAHLRSGHYEEALGEYATAFRVNPARLTPGDRLALHNNTGAALLALGRYAEATGSYALALAIEADYEPARVSMAALRARRLRQARDPRSQRLTRQGLQALAAGDLATAERCLRRSLRLQSDDAALLALGRVHERRGERTVAAWLYRALAVSALSPVQAAAARQHLEALVAAAPETPPRFGPPPDGIP